MMGVRVLGIEVVSEKLPTWRELKEEAVKIGLYGTDVFTLLDDETIEKEFNYIGPDRMPKRLRIFLSKHHESVLPAVLIHDLDFVVGGTKTEFHEANKRLRRNMKICIKAHRNEFTWIGYLRERIQIHIAYVACEWFGLPGWKMNFD